MPTLGPNAKKKPTDKPDEQQNNQQAPPPSPRQSKPTYAERRDVGWRGMPAPSFSKQDYVNQLNQLYRSIDRQDNPQFPTQYAIPDVPEVNPATSQARHAARLLHNYEVQWGPLYSEWQRDMFAATDRGPEYSTAPLREIPADKLGYTPTFWEDPKRIARYHDALQNLLPGQSPPSWLNTEQLDAAYRYFDERNRGEPWQAWKFLDPEDPARSFLQSMDMPPREAMLPSEIRYVATPRAAREPTPVEALAQPEDIPGYDTLPWWQKVAINTIGSSSWMGRLAGGAALGTVGGAVIGGLAGFIGGAGVGAIPGAIAGAAAGAQQGLIFGSVFAGGSLALEKGVETLANQERISEETATKLQVWIGRGLNAFDWAAEGVEKTAGIGAQFVASTVDPERYGPVSEVMSNLGAAYAISTAAATAAPIEVLNPLQGVGDVPRAAANATVWQLGSPEPQKMIDLEGYQSTLTTEGTNPWAQFADSLVWGRREIAAGAPSQAVVNALSLRYGFSGQMRELLSHMILDPAARVVTGKVTPRAAGAIGEATGNEALVEAARIGRRMGHQGPIDILRLYAVYSKTDTPIEVVSASSWLTRQLTGVERTGEVTTAREMDTRLATLDAIDVETNRLSTLGPEERGGLSGEVKPISEYVGSYEAQGDEALRSHGFDSDGEYLWAMIDTDGKRAMEEVLGFKYDPESNPRPKEAVDFLNEMIQRQGKARLPSGKYVEPETRVAPGTVEGLRPPNSLLERFIKLTPRSRAYEAVGILSDGVQTLINGADTAPEIGNRLRQLAEVPYQVGEDLSIRWLGAPEGQYIIEAIKDFNFEVLDNAEVQWAASETPRNILRRLAALRDVPDYDMVAMLADADNAPAYFDGIAREVATRAAQGDETAIAVQQMIDSGQFNEQILSKMTELFVDAKAPYQIEQYKAMVYDAWMDHVAKWSIDKLGVKVEPLVFRLSNVLKAAQSIALLDANPQYFVNNAVNNIGTMTVDGAFNLSTIGGDIGWWQDFGLFPFKLRQAYGGPSEIGDLVVQANQQVAHEIGFDTSVVNSQGQAVQQIADAASGKGGTRVAYDWIQQLRRKVGFASRLSGKIEEWSSVKATTAGAKRFWASAWREGSGYSRMPKAVEAALGPELSALVYGKINGSVSMEAVKAELLQAQQIKVNVDRYVSDVAQGLGMDEQMVAQMLVQSGAGDYLNERLATASNSQDVMQAFADLEGHVQRHLDELAITEYRTRFENSAAQAETGDWVGWLSDWFDLNRGYDEWWTKNMIDWSGTMDEVVRTDDQATSNALVNSQMIRSRQEAARMQRMERAVAGGAVDGLRRKGIDVPVQFDQVMKGQHEAGDTFFNYRDTAWREFWRKTQTRELRFRSREWKDEYIRINREVDRRYGEFALETMQAQEAMDDGVVRMIARTDAELGDKLGVVLGQLREHRAGIFSQEQDLRRLMTKLRISNGSITGREVADQIVANLPNADAFVERIGPWLDELRGQGESFVGDQLREINHRLYSEYVQNMKIPEVHDYFTKRQQLINEALGQREPAVRVDTQRVEVDQARVQELVDAGMEQDEAIRVATDEAQRGGTARRYTPQEIADVVRQVETETTGGRDRTEIEQRLAAAAGESPEAATKRKLSEILDQPIAQKDLQRLGQTPGEAIYAMLDNDFRTALSNALGHENVDQAKQPMIEFLDQAYAQHQGIEPPRPEQPQTVDADAIRKAASEANIHTAGDDGRRMDSWLINYVNKRVLEPDRPIKRLEDLTPEQVGGVMDALAQRKERFDDYQRRSEQYGLTPRAHEFIDQANASTPEARRIAQANGLPESLAQTMGKQDIHDWLRARRDGRVYEGPENNWMTAAKLRGTLQTFFEGHPDVEEQIGRTMELLDLQARADGMDLDTWLAQRLGPDDQIGQQALYQRLGVNQPLVQRAIAEFGLTDNLKEAGYILRDGTMLDFSGRQDWYGSLDVRNNRMMDHSEISRVFDTFGDELPAKLRFARDTGSVRVYLTQADEGFVQIYGSVSPEQYTKLAELMRTSRETYFAIAGFDNGSDVIHYRERVPSDSQAISEALARVEEYYPSKLYQRPEELVQQPAFQQWFGQGKAVTEEGLPKQLYHGTAKPGFDAFDLQQLDSTALYGRGIYMTENPTVAGGWYNPKQVARRFQTEGQARAWAGQRVWEDLNGRWIGVRDGVELQATGYAHKRGRIVEPMRASYIEALQNTRQYQAAMDPDVGYLSAKERQYVEDSLKLFEQTGSRYVLQVLDAPPYGLKFTATAEHSGLEAPGGVLPLYTNIQNPMVLDDPVDMTSLLPALQGHDWGLSSYLDATDRIAGTLDAAAQRGPVDTNGEFFNELTHAVSVLVKEDGLAVSETDRLALASDKVIEFLKAQGYDGLTHIGGKITGTEPHRVWIAWEPQQVKGVFNSGAWDNVDPRLLFQQADVAMEPAPPFYSHMERVVDEKMSGPMPADQLLAMLKNNGVKDDELYWSGMQDLVELRGTEQIDPVELQAYLASVKPAREEITYPQTGIVTETSETMDRIGPVDWEQAGPTRWVARPQLENGRQVWLTRVTIEQLERAGVDTSALVSGGNDALVHHVTGQQAADAMDAWRQHYEGEMYQTPHVYVTFGHDVTDPFYNSVALFERQIKGGGEDLLHWLGTVDDTYSHKMETPYIVEQQGDGTWRFWMDVPNYARRYEGYPTAQDAMEMGPQGQTFDTTPARWDSYTLPGGSNYKEHLFTLPRNDQGIGNALEKRVGRAILDAGGSSADAADFTREMGTNWSAPHVVEEVDRLLGKGTWESYDRAMKRVRYDYQSGHWDSDNVMAHVRTTDRTDAGSASKMLFVEEVQSDWHQAGREKGYEAGPGAVQEVINEVIRERNTVLGETARMAQGNGMAIMAYENGLTEFFDPATSTPVVFGEIRSGRGTSVELVSLEERVTLGTFDNMDEARAFVDYWNSGGGHTQTDLPRNLQMAYDDTISHLGYAGELPIRYVLTGPDGVIGAAETWSSAQNLRQEFVRELDDPALIRSYHVRLERASDHRAQIRLGDEGNDSFREMLVGVDDARRLLAEQRTHEAVASTGSVPHAPQESTWHEMVMRRMLRRAAEDGYDSIGWTSGDQQIERYARGLRQAVDRIEWQSRMENGERVYDFQGLKSAGENAGFDREQITQTGLSAGKLRDYLGDEMANRIVKDAGSGTPDDAGQVTGSLSGDNITVGGEGMRAFYDRIIRNYMRKYVKRWGAEWEVGKVQTGAQHDIYQVQRRGRTGDTWITERNFPRREDAQGYLDSLRNDDFRPFRLVRRRINVETIDQPATVGLNSYERNGELYSVIEWKIGTGDAYSLDQRPLSQGAFTEAERAAAEAQLNKPVLEDVHMIRLTPELRRSVLEDGQKLYQMPFDQALTQRRQAARQALIDGGLTPAQIDNLAVTRNTAGLEGDMLEVAYELLDADAALRYHQRTGQDYTFGDWVGWLRRQYGGKMDTEVRQIEAQMPGLGEGSQGAYELVDKRTGIVLHRFTDEFLANAARDTLNEGGLLQSDVGPKGVTTFLDDGRAIIKALQNPDFSTAQEELFHASRRFLPAQDNEIILRWGQEEYGYDATLRDDGTFVGPDAENLEEATAKAWQEFLREGTAPTPEVRGLFEKIKQWMVEVYHRVVQWQGEDIKITDEMRDLFARMTSGDPETRNQVGAYYESRPQAVPDPPVAPPQRRSIRGNAFEQAWTKQQWLSDRYERATAAFESTDDPQAQIDAIQQALQESDVLKAKEPQLADVVPDDGKVNNMLATARAQLREAEGVPGLDGMGTSAHGSDPNKTYDFVYRVVNLEDLIASHKLNGEINPDYPQQFQPRERDRAASIEQVDRIARELNPDALLAESQRIDDGPMIVGADGVVESGNGRTMGLQRALQDYPDNFNQYRQALIEKLLADSNLPEDRRIYGHFTQDALDAIDHPVLVRQRTSDVDRVQFVHEANESATMGMSFVENARADAQRIPVESLANLKVLEGENIRTALQATRNKTFVEGFIRRLPRSEQGLMVDADGSLSMVGTQRITAALFARALGEGPGQALVSLAFESTDTTIRRYINGVESSLGDLAQAEALVEAGRRPAELSIGEDLAATLRKLQALKNEGMGPEDYLAQQQMFGGDLTDFQRQLLKDLALGEDARGIKFSRSGKAVAGTLRAYARRLIDLPEIGQSGLFGDVQYPSKAELWQRALQTDQERLFQLPEGTQPGPVDGVPSPLPMSTAQQQAWDDARAVIHDLRDRVIRDRSWDNPVARDEFNQALGENADDFLLWLNKVGGDMNSTKMGAVRWGENVRDWALLDYSAQRGFDNIATTVMPYWFWPSRQVVRWGLRAINAPSIMANYYRLQRLAAAYQKTPGFPSRLEGKWRVPMPWLPDWMGGGVWIDPFRSWFPPAMFIDRALQASEQNDRVKRSTIQVIEGWVEDGTMTRKQADEILAAESGTRWQQAQDIAKSEASGYLEGPLDYIGMLSGLSLPIEIGRQYLRGTPQNISPLPITRTVKQITAALGIGGPSGVNLEAPIRRKLNLPVFDRYEEYRSERMMVNMLAQEEVSPRQVELAMQEHQGPVWDEAVRRVNEARFRGRFANPLFWLGFPGDSFPKGEAAVRGLTNEWNRAIASYQAGDDKALVNMLDQYPEYAARLDLWKSPQERLRYYLVDEIWTNYNQLNSADKELVRMELGQDFQQLFLEKPEGGSRNYDAIPVEYLGTWAQALGGYLPDMSKREDGYDLPAQVRQAPTAPTLPPAISEGVSSYRDERNDRFPNWYAVQTAFFEEPYGARDEYLAQHPELEKYWRWQKQYYEDNPEVKTYNQRFEITDREGQAIGQIRVPEVLTNPLLMRQLVANRDAGQQLSAGAMAELARIWEQMGQPGVDIQQFIDMLDVTAQPARTP